MKELNELAAFIAAENQRIKEAKVAAKREQAHEALVSEAAKAISTSPVKQPEPSVVHPTAPTGFEMKVLNDKVEMLNKWISKIANAGPGSGEVNFRFLDDVNRASITDNWVLEYDAATKKFQFTDKIGPIEEVIYDPTHLDYQAEAEGTTCWSAADKTLNIHHQNGVVQQVGQETYFLIRNRTGVTIPNGTVCMFAGAESDDVSPARLLAQPMVADGTFPSLYIMGVATEDIPDNGSDGFVTVFGAVRGFDTTGGAENWSVGDILYVNPAIPGKLTNVKPTSPNNVIPVAAVMHVGVTDGEIFVRPTIEQKMLYGRFSDTTQHVPLVIDTPYAITMNTTDVSRGFALGTPTSRVVADESGYYKFDASLSLTSTNSSAKAFYVWLRKNGVDVPNSAMRQSVSGNGVYQILHYTTTVSLNKDDYIEVMYAANDVTISIDSPSATAFAPAIPSIVLTASQIAL